MSDIEKNRAEWVMHLELQVQAMQQQIAELKAGDKWVPKLGSELNAADGLATISLAFGGKNQTARFSFEFLRDQSATDATTKILELGFQDFVLDRMRPVITTEVERLRQSVIAIQGAGKW